MVCAVWFPTPSQMWNFPSPDTAQSVVEGTWREWRKLRSFICLPSLPQSDYQCAPSRTSSSPTESLSLFRGKVPGSLPPTASLAPTGWEPNLEEMHNSLLSHEAHMGLRQLTLQVSPLFLDMRTSSSSLTCSQCLPISGMPLTLCGVGETA